MRDYEAFFKGKQITLMGLGLLGRGVGDARFLAPLCKELVVTDLKSKEELSESLAKLEGLSNITYHLGEHRTEDFKDRDLVIKAAGVPLDSPFIAEAKKNNILVRMSADLLVELAGVKTVGVTGTRGKSTVTHLIAHTLRQAGKRVLLGGNIRGVSNLSLLPDVQPDSILVLELDSWQLQGFGEAHISPNVAVFTNLLPDHFNYYGGDMNLYFADKANIFKFQKAGDVLVAGRTVVDTWLSGANPPIRPKVPVMGDWKLKIVGEHNRENAALAAEALRTLGVSEDQIKVGFESFEPVEGRLQLVREVRGVKIYNDNNATTPDATIVALQALNQNKNIILIMGGADKGLDMSRLVASCRDTCKKTLLLAGSGTEKIKDLLPGSLIYQAIEDALQAALKVAQSGDSILFSPALASFGTFKNEYDRNDQFVKAVSEL